MEGVQGSYDWDLDHFACETAIVVHSLEPNGIKIILLILSLTPF